MELRRIERKYLVFYLRVFDGMSSRILGNLVDISEHGLRLVGDGALEVNEEFRLRMLLPYDKDERKEIVFSATCRWCKKDSNPDFYLSGFQIHDLNAVNANLIKELIEDFGYGD